mmetsp:Transcript_40870/g.73842  ORF Transcript_40870/g.73842 Transcript_40870/m.73842 type:complete len:278 (+) Transcript_40870:88-921(+)
MKAIKAKLQKMLLTDSTLRKLSDAIFKKYDRDHSGHLDKREVDLAVNDLLRRLHIPAPPGVSSQAIKYFDKDRSGTIDRDEFFLIVKKAMDLSGAGSGKKREIDFSDLGDLDIADDENGAEQPHVGGQEMTPAYAQALLASPNLLQQLCSYYFTEYDSNRNQQLEIREVEEVTKNLRSSLRVPMPATAELRASVQLCSRTHADFLTKEEFIAWFTAELRSDLASDRSDFRSACKYGASCYQKNPEHKSRFSHPGDDDYVAPRPGDDDYVAPRPGGEI